MRIALASLFAMTALATVAQAQQPAPPAAPVPMGSWPGRAPGPPPASSSPDEA